MTATTAPAAHTGGRAATAQRVASITHARLAELPSVRVTGLLTEPARIDTSTGPQPAAWLQLVFQPPQGLPYIARLCLGTEPAARWLAEACMPYLVNGALISVAGDALDLQTDHGIAALRVRRARDLFIPTGEPITPNPQPEA